MEAKRFEVKVFVAEGARVPAKELIPVFHGWIQRGAVPDELLIDVTSYEHVVDGPGVLLIGHEGQYGYDQAKGKDGLLYSQRRARVDGARDALAYTLRHALSACALLERDEALQGRLKFDAGRLQIRINDRLRAPNTPETWKAVEADVRGVLGRAFGDGNFSVEPAPPSDELFTIDVRAQGAPSADTLLSRL